MSASPLRVAQIMGVMNGGGVEAVVMNYYRHINRELVQFDFIVCDNSEMIPFEEVENLGGRIFVIPGYKHLHAYRAALRRLFNKEQWEIVHSHVNTLSVFPLQVAKQCGVPVRIAHSHSTAGRGEFGKNLLKYSLRPFSGVYPTHKFACGQYAGKWLFGNKSNFYLMYNAVELDKFAFDEKARQRIRHELNIADDCFVVGHVGRFMTQKNHAFLINIFADLIKTRPNSILLLVGEGELRPLIEQQVTKCHLANKVLFLGQRHDPECLYQAFDAFVLPSLYEGLCLVGIEAQRAGLPCYLADTITSEVNVSGEVKFISINNGTSKWCKVLSLFEATNRSVSPELFKSYDVRSASQMLCNRYLEFASSDT